MGQAASDSIRSHGPTTTGLEVRRLRVVEDLPIEWLADRWLAAERVAVKTMNGGGSEARARDAGIRYEESIHRASQEDLLLAWHAARKAQAACEMGSEAWAEARSVSELIGLEYEACRALSLG